MNATKKLYPYLTRETWEEAKADLMKRDRILRKLVPKLGDMNLEKPNDPFMTLARSIVGQQISVKAADAVWQRLMTNCKQKCTPSSFLRMSKTTLSECGLPKRKIEYLCDLAKKFKEKQVKHQNWASMNDIEVGEELMSIRGIGRWTADMFLIFNMLRTDILPLDDLGLLKAISLNYFSGEPISRSDARDVAQNWTPWCTVATWYLWRSLDPIPVEY